MKGILELIYDLCEITCNIITVLCGAVLFRLSYIILTNVDTPTKGLNAEGIIMTACVFGFTGILSHTISKIRFRIK